MKFKFKKLSGVVIMDDQVRQRRTDLLNSLADGDYEILIRPEIRWDVSQMRKYFHGPVIGFIMNEFKKLGHVYTKDEIKEYLKGSFGPKKEMQGEWFPKSTSAYDFDTYRDFLKNINDWSISVFGYELPSPEEVE